MVLCINKGVNTAAQEPLIKALIQPMLLAVPKG